MLSTKREPSALCVPKLPLRQSTPGQIGLSAVFLVAHPCDLHERPQRLAPLQDIPTRPGGL